MRIATWNVNSVRQRLEHLLAWLEEARPDVVCLQELKCVDEAFPSEPIEALGYRVETFGQKGFNGVALLSKLTLEDVTRGLPGDEGDAEARYMEAVVVDGARAVRVASIYLPNGNPTDGPKWPYKLRWLKRLRARAAELRQGEEAVVLAGDFNVIPEPRDVLRPEAWVADALFRPESREGLRRITNLGYADAVRTTSDAERLFTFWDYQQGAFRRDDGIRIDHLLLSPQALDRLAAVSIDRGMRGREKPSDHVPVRIDLD